jgi:hypothetical protein
MMYEKQTSQQKGGINETCIAAVCFTTVHSHMLTESPRLFFLHFRGYDEPEKLASGLKIALAKINLAK